MLWTLYLMVFPLLKAENVYKGVNLTCFGSVQEMPANKETAAQFNRWLARQRAKERHNQYMEYLRTKPKVRIDGKRPYPELKLFFRELLILSEGNTMNLIFLQKALIIYLIKSLACFFGIGK